MLQFIYCGNLNISVALRSMKKNRFQCSLMMLYYFKYIEIDVITKDHCNVLKVGLQVHSLNFLFTGTHKKSRLQFCR